MCVMCQVFVLHLCLRRSWQFAGWLGDVASIKQSGLWQPVPRILLCCTLPVWQLHVESQCTECWCNLKYKLFCVAMHAGTLKSNSPTTLPRHQVLCC